MKSILKEYVNFILLEAGDQLEAVKFTTDYGKTYILLLDKNGNLRAGTSSHEYPSRLKIPVYNVSHAAATDPRSAIAALETTLSELGFIMPDDDLSPAALAVIRRWYKLHKDDGSVIDNVMNYQKNVYDKEPARFAGFKPPSTGLKHALKAREITDPNEMDRFLDLFQETWVNLYDDGFSEKTGRQSLKRILSSKDVRGLYNHFLKYQSGSFTEDDLKNDIAWVNQNIGKVKEIIADNYSDYRREFDSLLGKMSQLGFPYLA